LLEYIIDCVGCDAGRAEQAWFRRLEAVSLTLKRGDLVAWPVVLLKRPIE